MRANEINPIPDHLCCPITSELMEDPVILVGSGNTYERAAISFWLLTRNTDPLTNVVLENEEDKKLIPNRSIKNAIAHFRAQQGELPVSEKMGVAPDLKAMGNFAREEIKPEERQRSRRSLTLFALPQAPFNDKPDFIIRIGILGSMGSGGSQIINRYLGGEYHESYDESYYNSDGVRKKIVLDDKKIELQIFRDPFGGDSRSGRRCRVYPKNQYDCIILVADLTDAGSLSHSETLLKTGCLLYEDFDKKPFIFVATKSDAHDISWGLDPDRHCYDHQINCSAKLNQNISELFELAIRKRIELLENPRPIDERNKQVVAKVATEPESKCFIM